MRRTSSLTRWTALLAVPAVAFLTLGGCGIDPAPTEPEGPSVALDQIPEGMAIVSFTPTDGPAAKITGSGETLEGDWDYIAASDIGPSGGKVRIRERGKKGAFLKVVLRVPRGAMVDQETVVMAVKGWNLSELVIGFGPSGLEFLKDARLSILLGNGQVDLDLSTLEAYHDGQEVPVQVRGSRKVRIWVKVPGFSRYSLGGGNA
jgi:hypothetical protein